MALTEIHASSAAPWGRDAVKSSRSRFPGTASAASSRDAGCHRPIAITRLASAFRVRHRSMSAAVSAESLSSRHPGRRATFQTVAAFP